MTYEKRYYRKKLTTRGLIYLAGEELEVTLSNISVTGLLAELEMKEAFRDVETLFKLIKESPIVDIYLQEMRLAGEAEIVRADWLGENVYLALNFRNITHDVDNLFYERKAYRKNLVTPGEITLNGQSYAFNTVNVSVDGLMIRLAESIDAEEGTVAAFNFKRLDMFGEVEVVWVDGDEAGTLMGLRYKHLEKSLVKEIPRFTRKRGSS